MYYEHPVKCMNCGLHFCVLSWRDKWSNGRVIWCPECGDSNDKIAWLPREYAGEIFNAVPGLQGLAVLPT